MKVQWTGLRLGVVLILLAGLPGCKSSAGIEELKAEHARTQAQLDRISSTLNQMGLDIRALTDRPSVSPGYSPPPAALSTPYPTPRTGAAMTATPVGPVMPSATPGLSNIQRVSTPTAKDAVKLRVPGEIYFGSGKTTLDASSAEKVDQWIASIRRDYPDAYIRVEGFSDDDPIRKSRHSSNEDLSQRRAESVKEHMVKAGLDGSRIEAVGMGPVNLKSSKALSRRAELTLLVNQ